MNIKNRFIFTNEWRWFTLHSGFGFSLHLFHIPLVGLYLSLSGIELTLFGFNLYIGKIE